MAYQVTITNFEGPLDLLLQLVEQARLETSDLTLTELTEQYLVHIQQIEQINPSDASQFVVLASRLLQIKSQTLFNDERPAEELEELERELEEFGRWKEAAATLQQMWQAPRRNIGRPRAMASNKPPRPTNLSLPALQNAYMRAQNRIEATPYRLNQKPISIREMIVKLKTFADSTDRPTLEGFFGLLQTKNEVVAAFMAALELWRDGRLQLVQSGKEGRVLIQDAKTA